MADWLMVLGGPSSDSTELKITWNDGNNIRHDARILFSVCADGLNIRIIGKGNTYVSHVQELDAVLEA